MKRVWRNLLLLAVLVAEIVLILALSPDYTRPNLEFLPDMAHQPRFNAFAANPSFANHATLRAPVPGTLPRGPLPLGFSASPEDAIRAGQELVNPFREDDPKALARGKVIYGRFCVPCHGETGKGDGPVARRGYPPPLPLSGDVAVEIPDGQMFHIVTFGRVMMPSYATQISREDRWRVILFVRSLERKQRRPEEK
ncbi:MAG: cytochrome c [Acidobacteria bacterium]|nr:cytochrome c [Acidobacteriota bacterium]